MASETQTKIFGLKLGIDPKILVVGLMALAGLLFWLNSRGEETHPASAALSRPNESATVAEPPAAASAPTQTRRTTRDRRLTHSDRGTLKLKAIAPGSGEVDPVLRLDLLDKLAKAEPAPEVRNLFELETAPAAAQNRPPAKLPAPKPPPVAPAILTRGPITPQINIPLRYYGFAKPSHPGDVSRGFFMEGDDVLVAAEGQVLKNQYRIVQLTPTSAVVEDMQASSRQTLPVTPEAMEQGSSAFNRPNGPLQNGMMQSNFPTQNEGNEP